MVANREQCLTPKCCKLAMVRAPIVLGFAYDDELYERPEWRLRVEPLHREYRRGEELMKALPKYCPYCGSSLPEVELRPKKLKRICVPLDGYCGTCRQRLSSCNCIPPEFAWRIKITSLPPSKMEEQK